jgi:hypothetical protein
MSARMDRYRLAYKDAVRGDAAADATQYANLISMLAQGGGEIAATQLKKQEDAKKGAQLDAASKEVDAATAALAKIDQKTNPGSYVAAQARLADAQKRLAALTGAATPGAPSGKPDDKAPKLKAGGVPTWVWYAGGAVVGVGLLGLIVVKLASHKKAS